MNKKLIATILCFLFISLVGCSSTTTSEDIVPPDQRFYSGNYKVIYDAAKYVVVDMKWELVSSSIDEGILKAHIPMNMATNEDNITITFFTTSDGKTEVRVRSESPQMIDWGKGKKNIQQFYEKLDSRLGVDRN